MKKISKVSKILLLSFTFLLVSTIVFAASKINIIVNGEYVDMTVEPEMINNRTMIPLRAVLEKLGATVTWDKTTKTAIATTDDYKVEIAINSNIIKKTDLATGKVENIKIDQVAVVKNSRTLIPVRFVAEALGSKVVWNKGDKTVIVIDSNKYLKDYEKKLANVMQLLNFRVVKNKTLESTMTDTITLKMEQDGTPLDMSGKIVMNSCFEPGNAIRADILFNADIDEKVKQMLEANIDNKIDFKDIKFEVYMDKKNVFISTNVYNKLGLEEDIISQIAPEKLAEFNPKDLINGVYFNYVDILKEVDYNGEMQKEINDILDGKQIDKNQMKEKFDELIDKFSEIAENGDSEDMKMLNMSFDLLALCTSENYLKVKDNTVTYNFKKSDINNFVSETKKIIKKYYDAEIYNRIEQTYDSYLTFVDKYLKELEISFTNNVTNNEYTDGKFNSKIVVGCEQEDNLNLTANLKYNMDIDYKSTDKKVQSVDFSKCKDIQKTVLSIVRENKEKAERIAIQ